MGEELVAVVPDKVLQNLRGIKEVGPKARRILNDEGNMLTVNTKGLIEVAERLEAAKRVVKAERELEEEVGELTNSQDATKLIRDQQREIDGLQRRLDAKSKAAISATGAPAAAVDAKGTR